MQTYSGACVAAACTTSGPPGVSAGTCSGTTCVPNTTLCMRAMPAPAERARALVRREQRVCHRLHLREWKLPPQADGARARPLACASGNCVRKRVLRGGAARILRPAEQSPCAVNGSACQTYSGACVVAACTTSGPRVCPPGRVWNNLRTKHHLVNAAIPAPTGCARAVVRSSLCVQPGYTL